ncbi:MAG: hypothetical protein NHG36_01940, partial [Chromatiaceae bacterium]|nr:hypothetical protein [Candidatus Thioaporhodococcus sediminis]
MNAFQLQIMSVEKHARLQVCRFSIAGCYTYRGRQGADVALLVRRVRAAFNPDLIGIGTSATMATEGAPEERNAVVAGIASKLFGAPVDPANIITETLRRVTPSDDLPDAATLKAA